MVQGVVFLIGISFLGDRLPLACRVYVTVVIASGIPLLAYSVFQSFSESNTKWLPLAILTVFLGFFSLQILPSIPSWTQTLTVTIADVVVFLSLLLFGPYVAAVIASVDGFVSNFRVKTRYSYNKFFNVALLCWSGLAAGHFFYYMAGTVTPIPIPMEGRDLHLFFGAILASSFLFLLLNSGGVLLTIGLATRQPLSVVGKEHFLWSSLATIAGASIAAFIFLIFEKTSFLGIALAVPILVAIYFSYRVSLNRMNAALEHADQIKEFFHSTISSLAMVIEAKERYSHGNVNRGRRLLTAMAEKMRMAEGCAENLDGLKATALLHEIRKLATPEYILNKPSGLTKLESQKRGTYPNIGVKILKDAYTDALTGLPNLRYLRVFGELELKRAQLENYPVTLLVMDLNSFKSVNDRFGHQVGDQVLLEIAHLLRTQLRRSDTCIRYGGDEFVALLPGADAEISNSTMQRLRETVKHHEILLKKGEIVNIGLSVGGATFPWDAKDFDLLVTLADQAMYQDKLRHSKSTSRGAVLPFEARGNS